MTKERRKPIIVGNWKLHKTVSEAMELATACKNVLGGLPHDLEVGIAPVFTALAAVKKRLEGSRLLLTAQDCHFEDKGAHTGEVSVPLLADVGCTHVIVGHSERRQFFGEDDQVVGKKLRAVLRGGLTPILCIGELLAQREAGQTNEVVARQLVGGLAGVTAAEASKVVVAYEPVWAIGTGKVASTAQAQEVHAFLRAKLRELYGEVAEDIRIQYGGSVKPDNVSGLMAQPDIDGALVGGASLEAETFIGILKYRR